MSNDLAQMQKSLSVGSLGSYVHWANQIPILSAEEEKELAERLHKNNDIEAARKLVLPHLRFVISIARGYSGYGLQQADLIQEGNIGLMKAVKRFDPTVGVRLVSFAVHWIRAEIHEFVIRNWRIVKVATTKAQRKLFFNLRRLAADTKGWLSESEANMIAKELNVSKKDVHQMEERLKAHDPAFNGFMDDSDSSNDKSWSAPEYYLEDHSSNPAKLLESNDWSASRDIQLHEAITTLDERSQDILKARWLSESKQTLHDLADKYQVSAERIRQLEKNAMQKLRATLQH